MGEAALKTADFDEHGFYGTETHIKYERRILFGHIYFYLFLKMQEQLKAIRIFRWFSPLTVIDILMGLYVRFHLRKSIIICLSGR